jgi:hypothetical protein
MKTRKLTIFLFALLLLPTLVFAQYGSDSNALTFGVKAGWAWPQSDSLTDSIESGWIVGGDATWFFSDNFGLGLDVRLSAETFEDMLGMYEIVLDYSSIPISLNYYYRSDLAGNSRFYLGAGLSLVRTSLDLLVPMMDFSSSESEWGYGYNAVAGFQFSLIFVEAQYLYASTDFPMYAEYFGADDTMYGTEESAISTGSFNLVGGVRF